ncbi:ABC transporter ATP-binding protein [Alkalihalobacillus sp. NPDC078783]
MNNIIDIKNLTKKYSSQVILQDVNLQLKQGECAVIKGKSGAGKSTLLNILAGLEKLNSGEYCLFEENMHELTVNQLADIRLKHISYISQYSPMVPNLTVSENIFIPLEFGDKRDNIKTNDVTSWIYELIEMLEIDKILNHKAKKISGGEQQRVGIIRALMKKSPIIIADEPVSSLDKEMSKVVMELLTKLKQQGSIVILVSHDDSIHSIGDKFIAL